MPLSLPDIHRPNRELMPLLQKDLAMSEQQAIRSIETGIALADGYDIIGTGEMGIGNTTSSAAILAAVTETPAEEVVGLGTGVDDERMHHKAAVVREALTRH